MSMGPDGALTHERSLRFEGAARVSKLEGITASRKQPGLFFVTGSFEGGWQDNSDKRVVRLQLDRNGKADAQPVVIADPQRALGRLAGRPWGKVEAIELSADEDRLLMGFRATGQHWQAPRYGVTLLDYDACALSQQPRLLVDVDLTPVLGRPEGISALTWCESLNAYLLLTSYEEDDANGRGAVGSHLWVVPRDLSKLNDPSVWRTLPRLAFDHKAEGVELLADGRALVVFDDDDERKALSTPRLSPNEAGYSIVDVPRA